MLAELLDDGDCSHSLEVDLVRQMPDYGGSLVQFVPEDGQLVVQQ